MEEPAQAGPLPLKSRKPKKLGGEFIVRIFCYVNMSVMLKDDERGYKKRPPGGPECPGGKEGVGAQLLT